ncbi:MAG: hypothetical protein WBP56_09660 [Polyangia bacterium]
MTKDPQETLGALVSTVVTTGLTPKFGLPSAKVAGAAASQAVKKLIGLAENTLIERNTRKFQNWLHEVAAGNEHGSPEDTIQHIEDNIDQPWAHGPLEDAVRAIRDGIDEAALVYLAKLAAWQVRDKVPPDRWSRRAVGLLLDCDAPMVAALVHLTESLPPHWPCESGEVVRVAVGGTSAVAFERAHISPIHSAIELTAQNSWPWHPLYPELFALLRAHQFGTEESSRFAHEGKMVMRRHEAAYLVRLFLGAVAATKFPGSK